MPLKIDDDITHAVKSFNYAIYQAAWTAMPTNSNPDIDIKYSSGIKEKLTEKRKFRKP